MDVISEIRNAPEEGAKRLEREYKARLMAVAMNLCGDTNEGGGKGASGGGAAAYTSTSVFKSIGGGASTQGNLGGASTNDWSSGIIGVAGGGGGLGTRTNGAGGAGGSGVVIIRCKRIKKGAIIFVL